MSFGIRGTTGVLNELFVLPIAWQWMIIAYLISS